MAHANRLRIRRLTGLIVSSLAQAWITSTPIRAGDWPQWRGPNRDSVWAESSIVDSFPASGLKVRWRVPVGPGWSSPVISQRRVFLTDSELARPVARERVLCFEEATGKPLWTYAYEVAYPDWAFTKNQEAGPTSTPIVEADKVYALGGNGHVHCFDVKGKELWQRRLDKAYEIQVLICRASPLIDGNRLILFTGAKPGACVIALDKDSGNVIWKALAESVTNSSPIIVTAGGRRQLIVWTQESVTSLDPATGKTYWRFPVLTSNNDANSTPVFHKGLLLIGGLMRQLAADKPAASLLWPQTKVVSQRVLSDTSTALFRDEYIYSAKSSGLLVCLDAHNGKQVWQTDKVTDLKRGASIHITAHGGRAFLYTDRGELILAVLTPKGYSEIGRTRVLEPVYPFAGRKLTWSLPAFANGHVFARNEKELVCMSLAKKP